MNKYLIYAAVIAAALGLVYWHGEVNYDKGYAAREAIAVQTELEARIQAEEKRKAMQATADEAKRKADERAKKLETDAANSRLAADRLRIENANIRGSLPDLTEQAVRRYANTASIVLDSCTAEYQSMAGIADKIDNDRRELEEAWPQ